jgi:hypothetical protein
MTIFRAMWVVALFSLQFKSSSKGKSELGEVIEFEYLDEKLLEELMDFENTINHNWFK